MLLLGGYARATPRVSLNLLILAPSHDASSVHLHNTQAACAARITAGCLEYLTVMLSH